MSGPSLAQLTGDRRLIRRLEALEKRAGRRVTSSAVRKGLTVLSRGIRSEIPPKLQSVRRTIGSRFKRATKKHQTQAKAGLSVGKKRASKTPRRSSRGGVGISTRNVHWWALGTQQRRTSKGRPSGRMPANDAVGRGYAKSQSAATAAIVKALRAGLEREAQRG